MKSCSHPRNDQRCRWSQNWQWQNLSWLSKLTLLCLWTHQHMSHFTRQCKNSYQNRWPILLLLSCKIHLRISLHFNGHFPRGHGLAITWISPFCILLEVRMMEVVVTTETIRCVKPQSNHHHQQTNIQFFTGRMPFLSPNQQCHSTEGTSFRYLLVKKLSKQIMAWHIY